MQRPTTPRDKQPRLVGFLTALTGVLGLGEDDSGRGEGPLWQPPHQHWFEFARLLLEAGADPNDNQGLYNRMQCNNRTTTT